MAPFIDMSATSCARQKAWRDTLHGVPAVVLVTINARYAHASLALRCLQANLGELRSQSCRCEYTTAVGPATIVEELLALRPRILVFSCAIWNTSITARVMALCKAVAPQLPLVVGGPEITADEQAPSIRVWADHLICGEGESVLADCCHALLAGRSWPAFTIAAPADLDRTIMPYHLYDEEDIRHRIIYLEASRGCPYRCAFCASADAPGGLRRWPLEPFLAAWQDLLDRGARAFKFLDRSFNVGPQSADNLLSWFLDHYREGMHLHAEFVPDRLADSTRSLLQRFPPGSLQLEIGLQSCEPAVLSAVDRPTDLALADANLGWLVGHSYAHLHVDLIVGLPGETPESMAAGFDHLWTILAPAWRAGRAHIQVGILKRLPGTPLARREDIGVFDDEPPYVLLANRCFDFATLQRWKRFARYTDIFINSGRFRHRLDILLACDPSPAIAFMAWSDWLWQHLAQEHGISLARQERALADHLLERGVSATVVESAAAADHASKAGACFAEAIPPSRP